MRSKLLLNKHSSIREFYDLALEQIVEAESLLEANPEDIKNSVSKWSLHNQFEHLNLTGRSTPPRILNALASNEIEPISDNSTLLFNRFDIDRYTEEAPEFSLPKGTKLIKLMRTFDRMKGQVYELEPLLEKIDQHKGTHPHPILGALTPREWLMFMVIHQDHHLKIIEAILMDGLD